MYITVKEELDCPDCRQGLQSCETQTVYVKGKATLYTHALLLSHVCYPSESMSAPGENDKFLLG